MSRFEAIIARHHVNEGSLKSYVSGFVLSLVFTLTAYFIVTASDWDRVFQLGIIFVLAIAQFLVQIFFFLHLGRETRPRWKQLTFLFMITVVIIVVLGSIWIMSNLDYNHDKTPAQTDAYILKDEGVKL